MVHDNASFGYSKVDSFTSTNGHHKEKAEKAVENGITLEQYAAAKKLPIEFLKNINLKDTNYDFTPAIRMPYPDELGREVYHRYRVALKAEPRFKAPAKATGAKPIPYGLQVLADAKKAGYILLVEGESDAQVCWYNDIPALGIPGVEAWKRWGNEWAEHLHNIPLILVPVESDKGGETFWNRLRSTPELRGRLHKLPLAAGRIKDVGELWKHCVDTGTTSKLKETVENLVWLTLSTSTSLGISNVDKVEKLSSFGAVRLADVENSGPDEYLVRDLVMHSQPTYLYASEGACKSLITTALGIVIASPEVSSIFGYSVETHGPVILFDSELTVDRFKKRVVEICNGLDIPVPQELYYKNVVGVPPKVSFPELHNLADYVGAVAAVIDSIGFATRGDPESYGDVRNHSTEFLDPLIKLGVAPIVVDHKPHVGDHMIGSVAKGYHGRFIFRVDDKDRDDRTPGERHVCLVNKKASFTEEGHKIGLTLKFQPGAIRFEHDKRVEEQPINVSEPTVEERIKESLKSGDKTKEGIHNHTGIPVNTLSTRLKPMVNAKAIREAGKEGKKIVYSLYDTGPTEEGDIGGSPTLSTLDIPREDEVGKVGEPPLSYSFVSNDNELFGMVEVLRSAPEIAFDVETYPQDASARSLDPRRGKIGVISLSSRDATYVIDRKAVSRGETLLEALRSVLSGKRLVAHNAPFDLAFLRRSVGYEHVGPVYDTLVLDAMLFYARGPLTEKNSWRGFLSKDKETGYKKSLAEVVKKFLGIELDKEGQTSDWGGELTPEMVSYAAADASILIPLKDTIVEELEAIGMRRVVDLEARFTPAMSFCSDNGFALDVKAWKKHAQEAENALKAAKDKCDRLAPDPDSAAPSEAGEKPVVWAWNASNHRKVGLALKLLGAKVDVNQKTGNYKTDEAALKAIKRPDKAKELAEAILDYRAHEKYVTTWGKSWFREPEVVSKGKTKGKIKQGSPDHLQVVDGRVYTKLNQLVATGRGSSKSPNLQNLPPSLREFFVAPPGRKLLVADYSQMEYVAAAHISGDEALLEPLRRGTDYHTLTAQMIGVERSTAKMVNFALLYGMSAKTLASRLGVPKDRAQEYIDSIRARAPGLGAWCEEQSEKAAAGQPYAKTPLGRVRLVDQNYRAYQQRWESNRAQMLNQPIQGGCADGYKIAAAMLWERRDEFGGNPLLVNMIHDEFVLEVEGEAAERDAELLEEIMKEGMQIAFGYDIPVNVDVTVSERWEKGGNQS